LTSKAMDISEANGNRVVATLEGGYNLEALASSNHRIVSTLSSPGPYVIDSRANGKTLRLVDALKDTFSSFHSI